MRRQGVSRLIDHGEAACFSLAVVVFALVLAAPRVFAEDVGSVATLEGEVEIGRAGAWAPAEVGGAVALGDTLRTGSTGRVRVVLRDDTVLNLSEESELVIDEQVFDPAEGTFDSVLRLLRGKVRTLVSEYYAEPRARMEVQTETCVSGVRGTDFVVAYDPERQLTEVVGVSGTVAVRSVLIPPGEIVYVHRAQLTTVALGGYPTPPRELAEEIFRQYIDGLEFIGGGQPESIVVGHPLVGGSAVPSPDRAGPPTEGGLPGPEGPIGLLPGEDLDDFPDVSDLLGQPPSSVVPAGSGDVGVPF